MATVDELKAKLKDIVEQKLEKMETGNDRTKITTTFQTKIDELELQDFTNTLEVADLAFHEAALKECIIIDESGDTHGMYERFIKTLKNIINEKDLKAKLRIIVAEADAAILKANPSEKINDNITNSINKNIDLMNLKDIYLTVEDLEERKEELIQIIGYKNNGQPKGSLDLDETLAEKLKVMSDANITNRKDLKDKLKDIAKTALRGREEAQVNKIKDMIDKLVLTDLHIIEVADLQKYESLLKSIILENTNVAVMQVRLQEELIEIDNQGAELVKAVKNRLESMARSSPEEKKNYFEILLKEANNIETRELIISSTGFNLNRNQQVFDTIILQGIQNLKIGDINGTSLIQAALNKVNESALARQKAAEFDINKGIIDKLGDEYQNLSENQKIIAVALFVGSSPITGPILIAALLVIGSLHIVRNAERITKEFGKEVVHIAKNILDVVLFWRVTQLDKFLLNVGDATKQYHGVPDERYTSRGEQTTFAEKYKENRYIINALQEKIADKHYLRVQYGEEKVDIDIEKFDCEKFEEKASSKLDSDTGDFHALLNKLSCVVEDEELWEELGKTADKMKQNAEAKAQTAAPEKPGAEKAAEAGRDSPPPYSEVAAPKSGLEAVQAPNPAKPQSKEPE